LHGKRVDLGKVERYLRRRGTTRRQLETAALRVQTSSSSPNAIVVRTRSPESSDYSVSPVSMSSPTEYRVTEDAYRAIRDYYDMGFSGGRWVSVSPVDERVFLATESGGGLQDGSKRLNEFHQRFKLAFRLLLDPARTGPEGMKMARVCFAELPDVLAGEDPTMLYCVLDLVRRLREAGMDFLAVQLLQYLDGLASSAPRPDGRRGHAMSHIWRSLLLLGVEKLGAEQTTACTQIAASRFGAHLGPHHIKTLEARMWSMFLSQATVDEKEADLRELHAGLEALGSFDYRHLVVACDLASLLRKTGKLAEAAEVVTRVLEDPGREAVLRGFPPMAYNYLSVLGKIRDEQGRPAEAEGLYRDAIEIAKSVREDDDSDLLDGLVFLERCLRAQERHGEADAVLAEREAVVKESLERVGEKENTV
jgi:tetratricopeptide (TPR) repeat protein